MHLLVEPGAQHGEQQRAGLRIGQSLDRQHGQRVELARHERLAHAEQHGDWIAPDAPGGEGERLRGGPVEPLRIVDHANHRTVVCGIGQEGQHGHAGSQRVGRAARAKPEGRFQRLALGRRQPHASRSRAARRAHGAPQTRAPSRTRHPSSAAHGIRPRAPAPTPAARSCPSPPHRAPRERRRPRRAYVREPQRGFRSRVRARATFAKSLTQQGPGRDAWGTSAVEPCAMCSRLGNSCRRDRSRLVGLWRHTRPRSVL